MWTNISAELNLNDDSIGWLIWLKLTCVQQCLYIYTYCIGVLGICSHPVCANVRKKTRKKVSRSIRNLIQGKLHHSWLVFFFGSQMVRFGMNFLVEWLRATGCDDGKRHLPSLSPSLIVPFYETKYGIKSPKSYFLTKCRMCFSSIEVYCFIVTTSRKQINRLVTISYDIIACLFNLHHEIVPTLQYSVRIR